MDEPFLEGLSAEHLNLLAEALSNYSCYLAQQSPSAEEASRRLIESRDQLPSDLRPQFWELANESLRLERDFCQKQRSIGSETLSERGPMVALAPSPMRRRNHFAALVGGGVAVAVLVAVGLVVIPRSNQSSPLEEKVTQLQGQAEQDAAEKKRMAADLAKARLQIAALEKAARQKSFSLFDVVGPLPVDETVQLCSNRPVDESAQLGPPDESRSATSPAPMPPDESVNFPRNDR